ncbi:hypothetical protein [uncultured Erythrobacter sp.]|uniref:hypothetical protein n=1 Tax=uncultured Erythrobacter sp. TaxID=263913 RepID=UPI002657E7B2|nr:hypothetical protein [uncultured Erythrobacter sp.]
MTAGSNPARARVHAKGGPLVMLVVLVSGWSAARAVWWDNPFLPLVPKLDLPLLTANPPTANFAAAPTAPLAPEWPAASALPITSPALGWRASSSEGGGTDAGVSATHQLLGAAAPRELTGDSAAIVGADDGLQTGDRDLPAAAPFLPTRSAAPALVPAGRWSVDAWAFWRQGSNAAPISQGRVPIYGASQAGAVLQYRLAPASPRDPRFYARAYRAQVRKGESELALGASARPLGRVPLRLAGEVRYTDGAFSDTFRPAAYVVSELAPVPLPYGARLEAYGQAGWVGGPDPTGFADGQASVTGELRKVAGLTDNAVRLSLGAAAWGGAQKDAQRIDIGPTLRLDMTVGDVPARLSIDWRERVGGDAAPDSGLAATLSTRF